MENKKELFKALANFQQECPTIHKGTKGYGYTYADLPAIFEVINPLLRKNGLGFTQLMQDQTIKTILFHIETGQTLESELTIPQNVSLKGMNDYQVLGSAITYLRRYSISSLLGIVTDKDTDASGEQQKPLIEEGGKAWNKAISTTMDITKVKKHYRFTEESEKEYVKELMEQINNKVG